MQPCSIGFELRGKYHTATIGSPRLAAELDIEVVAHLRRPAPRLAIALFDLLAPDAPRDLSEDEALAVVCDIVRALLALEGT